MHPAAMKRSIVRDSAAETTHNMMSALRDALLAAITVKPTAGGGAGCIQFRACAVLYLLLCDHSVDRRDRCQWCRRSRSILGQWQRKCRIHTKSSFWLYQPDDVVLYHLTSELNRHPASDHGGAEELAGRPRLHRAPLNDRPWRRTQVASGAC